MPHFPQNEEITYIPDAMAAENSFLCKPQKQILLPKYQDIRADLPIPCWQDHEGTLRCYDKAWEIAFSNIHNPPQNTAFVSPFIDAAFNDCLFLWDSCFMLMFGKYAHSIFDFQQTLDNFYSHQHKDGFISREISEADDSEKFTRFDPSGTGPNVLSWCEWEYYLLTGDVERVRAVFPPLVAYHRWLRRHRTWPGGGYYTSGWGCGMDNQPRLQDYSTEEMQSFHHGHMIWVDACCQQIISCNVLVEMAKLLGRTDETADMLEEKERLTRLVNEQLWDPETGYYYDLWQNGQLNGVKSIAGYWALLAGIVPHERQAAFIAHLENEAEFNRPNRVPTLSADHPGYYPEGHYWRGSIWAPTNYMVLRGLRQCGYEKLAHEIALAALDHVVKTFEQTHTLWENYAPELPGPGSISRPDFVGWSGLFPITTLFEYVFGIDIRAERRELIWNIHLTEAFGVKQLPFGSWGRVDLRCGARSHCAQRPEIEVRSDCDFTLVLRYNGQEERIAICKE